MGKAGLTRGLKSNLVIEGIKNYNVITLIDMVTKKYTAKKP